MSNSPERTFPETYLIDALAETAEVTISRGRTRLTIKNGLAICNTLEEAEIAIEFDGVIQPSKATKKLKAIKE